MGHNRFDVGSGQLAGLQVGGQRKLNVFFPNDQLLQRGTLVLKEGHDLLDQAFRS